MSQKGFRRADRVAERAQRAQQRLVARVIPDTAHEAGIVAVIQPGGSMRDEEVIAAANEHGMAMVFTGMRHFRH